MPSRRSPGAVVLAALTAATACSPARPSEPPPAVSIPPDAPPAAPAEPPAAEPPAAEPPAAEPTPPGFMRITDIEPMGEHSNEEHQAFLLEGDHGSCPYFVLREAALFVRASLAHRATAALRQPYEQAADALAGGGKIRRAELTEDGNRMVLRFVVERGGRVESVDGDEKALPITLARGIPLFVQIDLLKAVGGWVEKPVERPR